MEEEVGFEPTIPVKVYRFSRPRRSTALPLFRNWSEMQDSNLRPSAPKADALPDCANLRMCYKTANSSITYSRFITLFLPD
jgi:hypothetical protein